MPGPLPKDEGHVYHISCAMHGGDSLNVAVAIGAFLSVLSESPVAAKPEKVLVGLARHLSSHFIEDSVRYNSLANEFIKSITSNDGVVDKRFMRQMMKTPIFREYLEWFRLPGDGPDLFKYIYSVLVSLKKVPYSRPDLDSAALEQWKRDDVSLANVDFDTPFVSHLKRVASVIFEDFAFDEIFPAHSGGCVSEKGVRGAQAKNEKMRIPYGCHITYCKGTRRILPHNGDTGFPDLSGYYDVVFEPSEMPARLTFVLKNCTSRRSICMEPIGSQFYQQGVLGYFGYYIASHWLLGRIITLEDQGNNREYARRGSFDGSIDTIDLTSASDLEAYKLVKKVLPISMLVHLMATRTPYVLLPDGELVQANKFAPMGSALCFPTQCCVFSLVVLTLGILKNFGRCKNDPGALDGIDIASALRQTFSRTRSKSESYFLPSVYGDDIVTDSRLTSDVMVALEELGFRVNSKKSFTGSDLFRESCGGHYLYGHDVTPVMIKTEHLEPNAISVEALVSLTELTNRAAELGYRKLATFIREIAMTVKVDRVSQDRGRNPILYSNDPDETFCIRTKGLPHNSHLRKRVWRSQELRRKVPDQSDPVLNNGKNLIKTLGGETHILFQRDEVCSIGLKPCGTVDWSAEYENYAYNLWMRPLVYSSREARKDTSAQVRKDLLWTIPVLRWTGTACRP